MKNYDLEIKHDYMYTVCKASDWVHKTDQTKLQIAQL